MRCEYSRWMLVASKYFRRLQDDIVVAMRNDSDTMMQLTESSETYVLYWWSRRISVKNVVDCAG